MVKLEDISSQYEDYDTLASDLDFLAVRRELKEIEKIELEVKKEGGDI